MKGITREKILSLSGFNIKEANINLKDIESAREAFITSTTKNVLPLLKIDVKIIGDGKPGQITTQIYQKVFDLKEN